MAVKVPKARNVPQRLARGRPDCGFTGLDWVEETQADELEALLELGYDPVRIVAAMPEGHELPRGQESPPPVVATEYVGLARRWLTQERVPRHLIQTFGATEVFPRRMRTCLSTTRLPGRRFEANGLRLVAELLRSSTSFVASQLALQDPAKRKRMEEMAMLMESVLPPTERCSSR